MDEIATTAPPDDRTPERRVFTGATMQVLGMAMCKACATAGIANYSPNSLRHRYASVKIGEGVPVANLAAQLGHARTSMTLTYCSGTRSTHVDAGELPTLPWCLGGRERRHDQELKSRLHLPFRGIHCVGLLVRARRFGADEGTVFAPIPAPRPDTDLTLRV